MIKLLILQRKYFVRIKESRIDGDIGMSIVATVILCTQGRMAQ